jgi:hypothetical protein
MNLLLLTPTALASFIAGIGLWSLFWSMVAKLDDVFASFGLKVRWRQRVLDWVAGHKAATLLITETLNLGSHGITSPLSVLFALGGTITNVVVIFLLIPLRRLFRRPMLRHR